jgi:hypothetical protein
MSWDPDVLPFAGRLLLLPLLAWRDAAMACPSRLPAPTEQALAHALSDPGLALDMWNTRDDVETAFCRFDCAEGRALLRARGQREHVHVVSERAALAVLVREALCEQDFNSCYGGFAQCIAMTSLHSH